MHQVGFPLPSGSRFSPLRLWLTHKLNGDTFFMVFPWRGTYNFSWCHSKHLCYHCWRCQISCFMWVNRCSPNTFTFVLIFTMTHWHCVITDWVHTLGDVLIINPTQTIFISKTTILKKSPNNHSLNKTRTLSWLTCKRCVLTPLLWRYSIACTNNRMILYTNVLIWCHQLRTPKAFLC